MLTCLACVVRMSLIVEVETSERTFSFVSKHMVVRMKSGCQEAASAGMSFDRGMTNATHPDRKHQYLMPKTNLRDLHPPSVRCS